MRFTYFKWQDNIDTITQPLCKIRRVYHKINTNSVARKTRRTFKRRTTDSTEPSKNESNGSQDLNFVSRLPRSTSPDSPSDVAEIKANPNDENKTRRIMRSRRHYCPACNFDYCSGYRIGITSAERGIIIYPNIIYLFFNTYACAPTHTHTHTHLFLWKRPKNTRSRGKDLSVLNRPGRIFTYTAPRFGPGIEQTLLISLFLIFFFLNSNLI